MQICTQAEFRRLALIHTQLGEFREAPKLLSPEERENLRDDIEGVLPRLIEIGNKFDIDSSDKLPILLDILDDGH